MRMFDFHPSNFNGFIDFVINNNSIISESRQVPDLTLTHFADELLIKITDNELNTITLVYHNIRWNLNFDLNSQIKIRYNKNIPEANQIHYQISDLQQVWSIPDR